MEEHRVAEDLTCRMSCAGTGDGEGDGQTETKLNLTAGNEDGTVEATKEGKAHRAPDLLGYTWIRISKGQSYHRSTDLQLGHHS